MQKLVAMLPLGVIAILTFSAIPWVYASPPQNGSGTFIATVTSASVVHNNDGTTLYLFSGPDVFAGTISGTGTFTVFLLVHPDGSDTGRGTVTCPCLFNGQAGTVNSIFTSSGTFGGSGVGHFEDTGSGGLAGLHAVGDFQFVTTSTGFAGPYQLEYHFDG
jgi:hypothetical protein